MGKSIIFQRAQPPEAVVEAASTLEAGYKANLYTTRRLQTLITQAVERWRDSGWFAPTMCVLPVIYRSEDGRDGVHDTSLRVPFAHLGNGYYLYPDGGIYVNDGTQKLKWVSHEEILRRSGVEELFRNLSSFLLV